MNILKKYLEKRKQEQEKRKQEEFLNTRIPLNELVCCKMYKCIDVKYFGESIWTMGKKTKINFN